MKTYVKNTGSAAQDNVKFLSFKPENWTVEFKPDKFDTIGPGELKQIEAVITPSEQALVGDYSVALSIQGEKVNKTLETRVTVRASTVWGWVGIGIIILVLAGVFSCRFSRTRASIWFGGLGTVLVGLAIFFTAGFNNTPFYPSAFDLNSSLSIYNASSSRYTLAAMSYIALAVPFVLGYIAYFWHLMDREKLSTGEVSDFNAKETY